MSKPRNQRLRLLLTLAFVVIAGLTAVLLWDHAHQPPPQIITLPDGSRFRFAGTTYSKKNVPPSFAAHLVSWLPTRLANQARRYVGKRISQLNEGERFETPQLFVWFQRLETNAAASTGGPTISAVLADQSGVEAGVSSFPGFASGATWSYARFPVLPRRSRMLHVRVYRLYSNNPVEILSTPAEIVTFPNPLFGHFDQWQAEPVPAVKQTGGLQVRLNFFAIANPVAVLSRRTSPLPHGPRYEPAVKGEHAYTDFYWSLVSAPGASESWVLHGAELSDATGNVLRDSLGSGLRAGVAIINSGSGGRSPVVFSPPLLGTLWPDEAAWRLKLVFKHASGFAPDELVTFTNVPVPAMGTTKRLFLKQTVGGIQIALTEFVQQPNLIAPGARFDTLSRIKVELLAKSEGVAVDFLETTPGVGTLPGLPGLQSGSAYVFPLQSIPTNVQSMYFTFAVQKTRSVEFLVAPPKSK